METYLPFCEQYAAMAQCFYSQYQQSAAGNDVIDSIAMEQSAICAVIFQALAVESYVNLFGSVILGDENFRNNYESETDKNTDSVRLKKLNVSAGMNLTLLIQQAANILKYCAVCFPKEID